MEFLLFGDMIKIRRHQLGISQGQLAEGICDISTLSRIENNQQMPGRKKAEQLLQKLGMPTGRYYALISKNDQEIANLESEIITCNVAKDYVGGLEKLAQLEAIVEEDDHLTKQFILRSKVLLGRMENDKHIPYSFEERMELLIKAIRMTSPRFAINHIESDIYSVEEMKIINQIAGAYYKSEQIKTAADICRRLLKHMDTCHYDKYLIAGIHILVLYNYAIYLYEEGRFEESIAMAEQGRQESRKFGKMDYQGDLLFILADCYNMLGKKEESKELYLEAYYTFRGLQNEKSADKVKEDAAKAGFDI